MGHSVRVRGMTAVCWALVTVGVVALTGCGTGSRERDVSGTVERFFEAVRSQDGEAACGLLVPQTRDDLVTAEGQACAEVLPMDRIGGTVREVAVWSRWARVGTDEGAVFLTEFGSGWLITAAGCKSNGDAPGHCVVGG